MSGETMIFEVDGASQRELLKPMLCAEDHILVYYQLSKKQHDEWLFITWTIYFNL